MRSVLAGIAAAVWLVVGVVAWRPHPPPARAAQVLQEDQADLPAILALLDTLPQPQQQSAPLPRGKKYNVTPTMDVSASFYDTGAVWCFQVNCQHWGTDLAGPEGTPVYAPFAMQIIALGEYPPGPTWGQYVQATFPDGYVIYFGHLEGRQSMSVGETLPAGTLLGFTNGYAHTHAQLAPPGNTGPCAQDGTCLDFMQYWETH